MNSELKSNRFDLRTKVTSVFLSATLLATGMTGLGGTLVSKQVDAATNSYGLSEKVCDGVILHAWNWSFNAIKDNMKEIAEAGYTSVQTSPVQRPKDASRSSTPQWDWWKVYQPTTICFSPEGHPWFGSKEDFKAMCDEADKYGVKIIVDVVANHMANNNGGEGNNRAGISSQNDPTYRDDDSCWHLNGSMGIDYSNIKRDGSTSSVTWGFGGWPDLNTGSKKVQNGVLDLLKECIDLGADGFRFDAAKHIELPTDPGGASDFWPTVIDGAESYAKSKGVSIYCYGEILDDSGTDIKNYTKYIGVTDNWAANAVRYGIKENNIGKAANSALTYNGVSYDKIVLWSESHDTYANDDFTGESTAFSQDQINRSWAIIAARQYPALYYVRPGGDPKSVMMGQASSNTSWKNKEVAQVNKFHNYFAGQSEYMSSSGNNVIVERGTEGVVIVNINGSGGQVSAKVNKMKDGTYKDQVSGNTFTVSGGNISGSIGDKGIAVVYNPSDNPDPVGSVSATPATGTTFTDTLTVTLKANGVTDATYKTSEGASGEYTDGKTITIGASVSEGGSVTVELAGKKSDGSKATASYTYNKAAKKTYPTLNGGGFVYDNSSTNWSNVYAYVYAGDDSSAISNASWPGSKMTDCGNGYWKYELDSKFSSSGTVRVIFSDQGNNQNPASQQPGYAMGVTEKKLYEGSWKDLPEPTNKLSVALSATPSTVAVGQSVTLKATASNASGTVTYSFAEGSNAITSSGATATWTPSKEGTYKITVTAKDSSSTATATQSVTVTESKGSSVSVDKASGTTFTTETLDVTLTLSNATSGTYSVDGGPVKTFTDTAKVTLGQGKIGDSTVTLDVTATDGSTTNKASFKYEKDYVVKTTSSSAALASYYSTNSKGVGKEKTITIDGDASDWSEDMLIAQGAAWDVANHWKGGHENCVLDTYALFGAWDDTNLYIGWQMVNTTDTWANPGDGPLSDGGRVLDVPLILALSIDPSSTSMSNKNTTGGPIWGQKMGLEFNTHVDRLLYMSGKPGLGEPSMFKAVDTEGNTDYKDGCVGFAEGGIEYKMATTNICSSIMGLNSSEDSSDVSSDDADWVDYKTFKGSKGVHDTTFDSFYEIKIPLKTLGITKDYLTDNGIGAMLVATRGESGLDCIPYDLSMVDNVKGDYGADSSTSAEKDDIDIITSSFARVGNGKIVPPTPTPLQVNFGADLSSPQYSSQALTLSAVGYGGTAPYTYEFFVDGTSVKADNATTSCSWTPSVGTHTIKCVIKDSTGKSATVEKTFVAEKKGGEIEVTSVTLNKTSATVAVGSTVTLTATVAPSNATNKTITWSSSNTAVATVTSAGVVKGIKAGTATIIAKSSNGKTAKATITVGSSTLTNTSTLSATSVALGKTVTITGKATGGTTPYKYAAYYKKSSSTSWTRIRDYGTTASMTFKPAVATTYDVRVKVKDASNKVVNKDFTVKVSKDTALTNTSTISATSIKLGTVLTITGKATGGTTPYKYAAYYKKASTSTWTKVRDYSTTATIKVTPKAATSYNIRVKVKDASNKVVNKDFTVKVTNELKNTSTVSATSIALGSTVTITGKATGGTTSYQYAAYYKKASTSTWTKVRDYSTTATIKVTPKAATSYNIRVKVKDASNKVVNKDFTIKVTKDTALANTSTISATSVALGTALTITGKATGGTTPYKYAAYYKKSSTTSWTRIRDYSTTAAMTFKPAAATTYDVRVKVKDASNKVVNKDFTVKVTKALTAKATVSASKVTKGNSVKVTASATGGTAPYSYEISYLKIGTSEWKTAKSYSTTTVKTITFSEKGNYSVRVKVKDAKSTVATTYATVTVS